MGYEIVQSLLTIIVQSQKSFVSHSKKGFAPSVAIWTPEQPTLPQNALLPGNCMWDSDSDSPLAN